MILNLDGEFVDPGQAGLPLNDGAILYGDSLFETL
jgi:branched-subunit amino acid aminotransferase/4-amino-4-deoxychorismate lyase